MVSISISMAGLLAAAALSLSRWGHSSRINALRRQDYIEEASSNQAPFNQAWNSFKCSSYGENCWKSRCCKDQDRTCYAKDRGFAECRLNCMPGIDVLESPKLQTPWSCAVVKKHSVCSKVGHNCTKTKCCQDPDMRCYYKDPGWAECKLNCTAGINPDEPKHLQAPWSCVVAGSNLNIDPVPAVETSSTTPRPDSAVVASQTCTRIYGSPSLYCFSLMMPFGYEVSLIRTQLAKGASIFSCNAWDVISNESVVLSPGPPSIIRTEVMPGNMVCKFGGPYDTALNSEIFWRVWVKVFELKRFVEYDWSVKMDPDAVWLPNRLLMHVVDREPASLVYLNNCDEGLHGPIEVISKGGMKAFDLGKQHCHDLLIKEWMTYGEDVWVRRCMGLLSVARIDDYMLLREKACKPFKDPMPCDTQAVAFHPLKSPARYFACLDQANYAQEDKPKG